MENTELDPSTFDLDAWLDGASRPETVVELHRAGHLLARLADIEARMRVAEATPPQDRSITDESPESLGEEWSRVAQEWADSALRVRVRALTTPEIKRAYKEAKDAKASDDDQVLWVAAAGTIEPKLSPQDLIRLRDAVSEGELALLTTAVLRLSREAPKPTPPSWPGRSRGTRG